MRQPSCTPVSHNGSHLSLPSAHGRRNELAGRGSNKSKAVDMVPFDTRLEHCPVSNGDKDGTIVKLAPLRKIDQEFPSSLTGIPYVKNSF